MQIYLKDKKLWVKEYLTDNLVDVTSEAEKYLFTKYINTDNATLADFFAVLNENPHLKAIFAEKKKKEYKNVVFKEPQVEKALLSESTLYTFLEFYKNKTDDEVDAIISKDNPLDFFEIEVTYETEENDEKSRFIDFVGVRGDKRYSMSLASIDNYYFTPITIRYYKSIVENDENFFEEIGGSMKMSEFFFKMSDNLKEMIFEKDRATMFD